MKILSASQLRELDVYTIHHEPISSIELMERASQKFVEWFVRKFEESKPVMIFCGPGNNGGDGLAVARLLLNPKYSVEVYVIYSDNKSEDFVINEHRYSSIRKINYIRRTEEIPDISNDAIVIDAIFGSGLSRPVAGVYANVVDRINQSHSHVIAIDIASGLFCDQLNEDKIIVCPADTVTFQSPKLSMLLPQNEKYVGNLNIVDIGLDRKFIDGALSRFFFTDEANISSLIKPRNKFSHKGTYGTALVIGGSYGMIGAAVLMSKACLRTGVGLCVSYIPKCGYDILQSTVPENMVLSDPEHDFISDMPELAKYDAIAVGPGLGKSELTVKAISKLLERAPAPLVIDADALNIISENKSMLDKIPASSILTPHPKEFERLAGKAKDDYQRLYMLRELAMKLKSVVVLKGAYTAIANPEGEIHFNSTGNAGMATGGSGDVLTGILVSLRAQGYDTFDAARLGVYLHGYAGDVAANKLSQQSMIASDIIENIGEFFKKYSQL